MLYLKQINYVSEICVDCQKDLLAGNSKPVGKPKSDLGWAILSAILGFLLALFQIAFVEAALVATVAKERIEKSQYGVLIWLIITALCLVVFIRSIKSIAHFSKCRKKYGKKFAATLVFGIFGVILSGIALSLSPFTMVVFF